MTPEEFQRAMATIDAKREKAKADFCKADADLVAERNKIALDYFNIAPGDIVVSRREKYEVRGIYSVFHDALWLRAAKLKKDGTPGNVVATICDWSKP